jgi:hypothetical protein
MATPVRGRLSNKVDGSRRQKQNWQQLIQYQNS